MFPSSNFLSSALIISGPSFNHRSRLFQCFNTLYHCHHHMTTLTTVPSASASASSSSSSSSSCLDDHHSNYSKHRHNLTCDNLISLFANDSNGTTNNGNDNSTEMMMMMKNESHTKAKTSALSPILLARFFPNLCHWLLFDIIRLTWTLFDCCRRTVLNIVQLLFHRNIILTYLIFISYWPSLWAELVFDDRPAIIENVDIRPETPWSRIWFDDYWGTPLKSALSHKSYRPLTVLTFRINYIIHQLDPFGYHLVNLFFHSIATILFYKLCQRFQSYSFVNYYHSFSSHQLHTKTTITSMKRNSEQVFRDGGYFSSSMLSSFAPRPSSSSSSSSSWEYIQSTPFLMATIFAVHPIHTDCVCSVVGRAELLSAIFYLLAILSWDHQRSSSSSRSADNLDDFLTKNHYLSWIFDSKHHGKIVSILFALCGFLCKEQSIFVLIYLAVHHLTGSSNNLNGNQQNEQLTPWTPASIVFRMQPTMMSMSEYHRQKLSSPWTTTTMAMRCLIRQIRKQWKTVTLLAFVFLMATYIRFVLMDFSFPIFNRFDNPASRASFPFKQLTYGYLALYHYWLMFYPAKLSCDWTHSSIELIDFKSSNGFYSDLCRSLLVILTFCFMSIMVFYLSSCMFNHKQKPLCRNGFKARSTNLQVQFSRKILKALALTVIPFLPVSNLFFPVGFVIAERVLYLPSIGFLLLLGLAIDYLLYLSSNKLVYMKVFSHKSSKNNGQQQPMMISNDLHSKFNKTNMIRIWNLIYVSMIFVILAYSIKTFYRSNNWTNELNLYESGLRINPQNTKLLNNLGRLHEKNNLTNMAIDLYKKAIKIEPKDLRSYLNLGNVLIKNNDKEAAERILRQALKQAENEANDSYLGTDRQTTTTSLFHLDQISLSPLYLTTLIRLAELLDGDHSKADDLKLIHQKIFKIQSSLLVQSPMTSCDSQCNLESYRFDYEWDSHTLDHLYNMGVVHYQQGHWKEALSYFEQVLILNPHHENSLLTSARIIQEENIHQLKQVAFNRLDQLVKLGKGDEFIYFNLATMAVNSHKFLEARHLFEKAISKRESFAEAHYNLALLLIKEINNMEKNTKSQMDNLHQAIEHLKSVLAINPKHENSMFILGELYAEELNQLDISEYYYQMIIDTVNPKNEEARHNLCVLSHKQGKIDKAIGCFQSILAEMKPKNLIDSRYFKAIEKQISVLVSINQHESIEDVAEESTINNHLNRNSCLNVSHESNLNAYKHLFVPNSNYFSTMCFI